MLKNAPKPVHDGMHTITVHLWFNGNCNEAIEFYQKAFRAKLGAPPVPTPDFKGIIHAMLKLSDSNIMMADTWRDHWEQDSQNNSSASIWL